MPEVTRLMGCNVRSPSPGNQRYSAQAQVAQRLPWHIRSVNGTAYGPNINSNRHFLRSEHLLASYQRLLPDLKYCLFLFRFLLSLLLPLSHSFLLSSLTLASPHLPLCLPLLPTLLPALSLCVAGKPPIRRSSGAIGLECPWAVLSLPLYLVHCQ